MGCLVWFSGFAVFENDWAKEEAVEFDLEFLRSSSACFSPIILFVLVGSFA